MENEMETAMGIRCRNIHGNFPKDCRRVEVNLGLEDHEHSFNDERSDCAWVLVGSMVQGAGYSRRYMMVRCDTTLLCLLFLILLILGSESW